MKDFGNMNEINMEPVIYILLKMFNNLNCQIQLSLKIF